MTFTTGTRKLLTTLSASLGLVLAIAAPASAAQTMGADVSPDPTLVPHQCPLAGSTTGCTYVLPTPSPVSGVVVRWRVHTSNNLGTVGDLSPQVVRFDSGANYTGIATGAHVNINVDGVTATDTRLPIQSGQYFALTIGFPGGPLDPEVPIMFLSSGSGGLYFKPAIGNGTSTTAASYGVPMLANADIEPDADGDGYGDETQDACPSIASRHSAPCVDPPPAATCKVPKLKGLKKAKAKTALVKAGCKLGKTTKKKAKKGKKGRVTKQSPAAGKVVPAGTSVKLTLRK